MRPFTYAAFNASGIAPGILSYEDLKKVYHYSRINANSRVFGVIGDPIGHSLSPLLHNTAFQAEGVDAVYLPFRVQRSQLEEFLEAFKALPAEGFSVTIPHKETAAELATERDPAVVLTRAANTLVRRTSGFSAYNTDYQAARDSLLANMPPSADGTPPTLTGRVVLIVGAGGVAHAIAHALHREGSVLTITNRTYERAQRLAEEVGCRGSNGRRRQRRLRDAHQLYLGRHDAQHGRSPIIRALKPGFIVMDCVYTPENTILIRRHGRSAM